MGSQYIGSELDLFSNAHNWKAYWSGVLKPYMGSKILDVGAGIGGTAKVFAELPCETYLALEPDDSLAQRMRHDANTDCFPDNFQVETGTSQDLSPDRQFDTILYIDVLEHIAKDREELDRVALHLTPGGRIVVLSPAHQWLYSEFDAAIGHVQRYNRQSLLAAKPAGIDVEKLFYLDSVGLLASLGNRLFLKASSPTAGQIKLWDGRMIPASRLLDRLTGFIFGKSIVAIFKKPQPDALALAAD